MASVLKTAAHKAVNYTASHQTLNYYRNSKLTPPDNIVLLPTQTGWTLESLTISHSFSHIELYTKEKVNSGLKSNTSHPIPHRKDWSDRFFRVTPCPPSW